jgi:hypothetical protein
MSDNLEEIEEGAEQPGILKPKRKHNLSDEQRAMMRERMLRVNADRIKKAQDMKDKLQKEKEEVLMKMSVSENKSSNEKVGSTPKATIQNKKIEKLERTIQAVKSLKGIQEQGAKKKKSKKPLVLEVSSESDTDTGSDSGSDSDGGQPVILVKKSKSNKSKSENTRKMPDPAPVKQTICRFI